MKPALSTYLEKTPRALEQCVDEIDRELSIRRKCYDRWVAEGKLSFTEACDRISRLESAKHYLSLVATTNENTTVTDNNNAADNITPLTAAV